MSLDTRERYDRLPSIGVDAIDLERYSDVQAEDGELLIFDENDPGSWIQSDTWIAPAAMD